MESGDIPSDTLASVHLLHKQYFSSVDKSAAPPLPLVLIHQLYSVLKDRTVVDTELEEARQQGRIRLLKLSSSKDVVVALEKDYRDFVLSFSKSSAEPKDNLDEAMLKRFHDKVLLKIHTMSLDQPKFIKLMGCGKKEGNEIILKLSRAGFLVRSVQNFDEAVYLFGLPAIGMFITSILSARKAIVAVIKRNKYKEILESKLDAKTTASSSREQSIKRQKLSKSRRSGQNGSKGKLALPYGTKFHVDDVIGCGLVREMKTPSGRLLKLVDR